MPAPTIVGTVTRTNSGDFPYTARLVDRTVIGNFKSVRDAQIPVEQSQGARLLRWTRQDLAGDIEFYFAERP